MTDMTGKLKNSGTPYRCEHCAGFTLLELLVVSILMAGIVTATAQFWKSYSLSTIDLVSRGNVTREMRFVVEYLSADFGAAVGATPVGSDRLVICRDSGLFPNGVADWMPPDVLVEYYVLDGQLRRYDQSENTEIAVAGNILSFEANDTDPSVLRLDFTIASYNLSRDIHFSWSRP